MWQWFLSPKPLPGRYWVQLALPLSPELNGLLPPAELTITGTTPVPAGDSAVIEVAESTV